MAKTKATATAAKAKAKPVAKPKAKPAAVKKVAAKPKPKPQHRVPKRHARPTDKVENAFRTLPDHDQGRIDQFYNYKRPRTDSGNTDNASPPQEAHETCDDESNESSHSPTVQDVHESPAEHQSDPQVENGSSMPTDVPPEIVTDRPSVQHTEREPKPNEEEPGVAAMHTEVEVTSSTGDQSVQHTEGEPKPPHQEDPGVDNGLVAAIQKELQVTGSTGDQSDIQALSTVKLIRGDGCDLNNVVAFVHGIEGEWRSKLDLIFEQFDDNDFDLLLDQAKHHDRVKKYELWLILNLGLGDYVFGHEDGDPLEDVKDFIAWLVDPPAAGVPSAAGEVSGQEARFVYIYVCTDTGVLINMLMLYFVLYL